MSRLIQTVALGATLVTLGWGIWHGSGLLTVLRRMATAYLVFFFAGGLLLLAARALAGTAKPAPPEDTGQAGATRRWRRKERPPATGETPVTEGQPADS